MTTLSRSTVIGSSALVIFKGIRVLPVSDFDDALRLCRHAHVPALPLDPCVEAAGFGDVPPGAFPALVGFPAIPGGIFRPVSGHDGPHMRCAARFKSGSDIGVAFGGEAEKGC